MDERERQEAISAIRSSLAQITKHMPGKGEGFLLLSTAVAVVNTNQPAKITPQSNMSWDDILCHYVSSHESIHVSQIASTTFAYNVALDFAGLVSLANRLKREKYSDVAPRDAVERFESLNSRLYGKDGTRFSAMHIMEAHAVLEGFRGAFSRYTQEGLILTIQNAHDLDELYSDIIGMWLQAVGFDCTFAILPKVCWLALQSNTPAAEYERLVGSLLADPEAWVGVNVTTEELAVAAKLSIVDIRKKLLVRDKSHPMAQLWCPYITACERILAEGAFDNLVHPSPPVDEHDFMPALTIFRDGTLLMTGPYKDKGWDIADPLIKSTAVFLNTLEEIL